MAGGAGARLVWPVPFSVDAAGIPRAGAKLWTYATGTSTPMATYNDAGLSVANTNPIIADSAGQFGSVFMLPASYKLVLLDANDVEIWEADPCGFAVTVDGAVKVGAMFAWPGASLPAGYLWCDGSAVSRVTYADLFAIISTNYGIGNGSTTFNLPDKRGRLSVGRDDMGGTPANRVTVGGCGVAGTTLGAVGGNQLAQQHNHTGTTDPHNHTKTDPGHYHGPPNKDVPGGLKGLTYWDQLTSYGHFLPGVFLPAGLSPGNTSTETTGITIDDATVTVTVDNVWNGNSQNMPPVQVDNVIIYAGA